MALHLLLVGWRLPKSTVLLVLCIVLQAAHRRLHRHGRRQVAVAALSLEAVKDVGALVLFSALPFVAVQALADSK